MIARNQPVSLQSSNSGNLMSLGFLCRYGIDVESRDT